jgi:diacylglycerol kinase family enzyme
MRTGSSRFVKPRRHGPAGGQPERQAAHLVRRPPAGDQNAKRNFERYLELARAEALSGNTIAAENYYQHAEHYYRSMREPDS